VTGRQVIYTHPATGAETRLLSISEHKRNQPISLDAALHELADPRAKLLVNERSARAAVQIPTTSVMLDDGEIEPRVRLLRPMESTTIALRAMGETRWIEADRDSFAAMWSREVALVPAYSEGILYIVAGLLLPV